MKIQSLGPFSVAQVVEPAGAEVRQAVKQKNSELSTSQTNSSLTSTQKHPQAEEGFIRLIDFAKRLSQKNKEEDGPKKRRRKLIHAYSSFGQSVDHHESLGRLLNAKK